MDCTRAVTRAVADFATAHLPGRTEVCVGLSGGPDSLALTAGALRAGLTVRALIVDHALQPGSDAVAANAARTATGLGASAEILRVSVGTAGGMEAAAREARYAALDAARDGMPVLLAHTMDDQAETVLLGLGRGSGARSLAGMRAWREPWGRPLLGVRRSQTVGACTELALPAHADPHNRDPRFTRVRLRAEVIPLLDDVLHGGVVEALARTATALQADVDALDDVADEIYSTSSRIGEHAELDVASVADLPDAVRTRVVRRWLREVGATEPTTRVIEAVDELLRGVRPGQVAIGGTPDHRLAVERTADGMRVTRLPR
ncbi:MULTISPECIES: tRNA lysidine(34) synthetase TilS [Gordonia]|uniref:tRNA(Ile)-lysidine synthase n=1 Tax=Gordonia sputi NBRC 100414 TaxID=1089453 RepID=H5U429_9ACTN|nr:MULTISPECIES: tRNA lysidine(34) synthetase TilS [Gordonia]NKY92395.1 tRNA lysidine(34) synthetase TilS [Gordonia sputi]OBA30056.1 tRNA lysidine(34) synthetase TilS [Gordonia sp. 852002-51296_SCH5728562-b]GAB40487.1 tRNA(Ile)-lysidine synthase [Gordonia sputi NBRC 100414]